MTSSPNIDPSIDLRRNPGLPVPVQLSIIIPTLNERGNLRVLVEQIEAALEGVDWEVIFVDDDSRDGTADEARALYRNDARIRCIMRLGRRGLASACIEGMLASSANFLVVMDADLQHDPAVLRSMYDTLAAGEADLVIGSRYTAGGSVAEWNRSRFALSRFATNISVYLLGKPVADPMSGYFALKRQVFEKCVRNLSSLGFKILLDILISSKPGLTIREIPFKFRKRLYGESKLSTAVIWEFLLLIADKLLGKYLPVRFIAFGCIGMAGVLVHYLVLFISFKIMGFGFAAGQTWATVVAILFNYSLNNLITYSDRTLRSAAWFKGLITFYLICSVGALANVGVASYLFRQQTAWPLAAASGIAMSLLWNYAVSARYTWNVRS